MTLGDWRVIGGSRDRLGESPLWHPDDAALWWIDFYGPIVRRLDPATDEARQWTLAGTGTVGSIAFAEGGRLLAATDAGIFIFDPTDGSRTPHASPITDAPSVGYNDAKVNRDGRYWVGTYDRAERDPIGAVYRIDADGRVDRTISGFVVCNGPAFSADGMIMYFSDTVGRRILAFDLDPDSGLPGRPRPLVTFGDEDGLPDGLCVDASGALYCAHYGGGCVTRHSPEGALMETIRLPVRNVTSCCLGGASLDVLYVTSGEDGGRHPLDGSVFGIAVDVPGLPEPVYVMRQDDA